MVDDSIVYCLLYVKYCQKWWITEVSIACSCKILSVMVDDRIVYCLLYLTDCHN